MGITDTLLFFMLAVIVLAAMFIMFAMVVTKFRAVLVETGNLESDILIERLTYSSFCLAYYDLEIKRTYPNTIDLTKLTQSRLDDCYDNNYNVKILVSSEEAGVEKLVTTTEQPAGVINKYVKSIILFNGTTFNNGRMEVYVSE